MKSYKEFLHEGSLNEAKEIKLRLFKNYNQRRPDKTMMVKVDDSVSLSDYLASPEFNRLKKQYDSIYVYYLDKFARHVYEPKPGHKVSLIGQEGNEKKKWHGQSGVITKDGKSVELDDSGRTFSLGPGWKAVPIKESLVNERIVKIADGKYDIKKTNFKFLQRVSKRGLEGIVFLGAGGDLNQWVNGINDLWNKDKIGSGLIEDKMMGLYQITTSGGRTDLVMIFKTKSQMEIGKLAMWRLRFGDASWLSDYVVNYRDQQLD